MKGREKRGRETYERHGKGEEMEVEEEHKYVSNNDKKEG